jgi:hypothetical protein
MLSSYPHAAPDPTRSVDPSSARFLPRRPRMQVALALLAAIFVLPPAASTAEARGRSYWTASKAERLIERRYSNVVDASCMGLGYDWRYRRGREVFRGFYCGLTLDGGDSIGVVVNVTGRRSFRVTQW